MYKIYEVEPGDTIFIIADKTGSTPEEIRRLNGLTLNQEVSEGAQIIVPVNNNSSLVEYEIKKGDTIYELARKYNANYTDLLKLNGLNKNDYIYPGQRILVPNDNVRIYVTSENDTVKTIENKMNTNIKNLMEQNDDIYVIPEQLIVYDLTK